jgi:RimJ/RimL family protein N-acetyltransferase
MFAVTERLLLRPGWAEDAPALFAAFRNPDVITMLSAPPWPYQLNHAEEFLTRQWPRKQGFFLITDRKRGSAGLIGGIGLHASDNEIEIGYWLAREHWGKGYATEAGKAIVALARDTLKLPRLVSGYFVDNPASGKVLHKLGFRPTGQTEPRPCHARGKDMPTILMRLDFEAVANGPVSKVPPQQMQMMLAA